MKAKTSEAVAVYNTLKSLRIGSLPKEDRIAVLRATKTLRGVAESFDGFLRDAQERLRPEGFDALAEKARAFDSLSEAEKADINRRLAGYQKEIDDCVKTELDRDIEIDDLPALSEEAVADIAASNESLDVQTLILLQDLLA